MFGLESKPMDEESDSESESGDEERERASHAMKKCDSKSDDDTALVNNSGKSDEQV